MQIAVNTGLAKRKRMVLFAVGMIVLAATLCLLLPCVYASASDDLGNVLLQSVKILEINMWDIVANILLPHAEMLNNPLVSTVSVTITSIAASLFVVTIFISVINEASKGEATLDFFLRIFIRIAITLMVLMNLNELLNAIQMGMTWMIHQIHSAIGNVMSLNREAEARAFSEAFANAKEAGWGGATKFELGYVTTIIHLFLANILVAIIKGIIVIVLKIGAYSLLIEFVLRKMFMPVAFLGFMEEGMRSPGLRYLKRYIGMYVRIIIYLVAFAFADYLSAYEISTTIYELNAGAGQALANVVSYALSTIIFAIAASSFSRKGAKLVDEILGV